MLELSLNAVDGLPEIAKCEFQRATECPMISDGGGYSHVHGQVRLSRSDRQYQHRVAKEPKG